jgi:AcrR family transcriptional regulator
VGRPKSYHREAVLAAARDLFWERGYEATSVADLEQQTGLNRSSIYQEFGSKHGLFEAALACYADQVISMLFADVRKDGAGLDAVVALFTRLAELFRRNQATSTRGCLMINTIAELAARDDRVRPEAAKYRDRLRTDFAAALGRAATSGEIDTRLVEARANLLASTLMGVWLAVRIDPVDAAAICQFAAREVASWRRQ